MKNDSLSLLDLQMSYFQPILPLKDFVGKDGHSLYKSLPFCFATLSLWRIWGHIAVCTRLLRSGRRENILWRESDSLLRDQGHSVICRLKTFGSGLWDFLSRKWELLNNGWSLRQPYPSSVSKAQCSNLERSRLRSGAGSFLQSKTLSAFSACS